MICDEFIARIHFIILRQDCPRLFVAAKKMISEVGHWYLEEKNTYIKVFGAVSAPHLLPTCVPNRLVLGEKCYQTILQGFNASLVKDMKRYCIPYSFHNMYHIAKYTMHSKQEGLIHLEYRFPIGQFRRHDTKGIVPQHVGKVVSHWPYAHDSYEYELFTKNAQYWEDIIQRKAIP